MCCVFQASIHVNVEGLLHHLSDVRFWPRLCGNTFGTAVRRIPVLSMV